MKTLSREGAVSTAEEIGRRITEARLAAGYRRVREFSQSELAEMIDVSPPTVGRYERGVKRPEPERIEMICTALDADPGWMTYGPARPGLYAGAMSVDVSPTVETRGGSSSRPVRGRRSGASTDQKKRRRSAPFLPAMWWGTDALPPEQGARKRA